MAKKKASKYKADEVPALVLRLEDEYTSGPSDISKYVQFDQYENVNKIDAYLNSKHISGETDSMGREKPFFNIVTAAVNIWYRATDLDRKHMRIKPTKRDHHVAAYVATLHLQDWMRRSGFGAFLNDWGRSLARYGSSVLKFTQKGGELIPTVVPWNRIISDTVDFENNPVIEILYYTPAQLRQHKLYDQEMVEALLDSKETRKKTDGTQIDDKADYIKLYELHGNLPLSYLTGKESDEDTYVQQMHVLSFTAAKRKGEYNDFCLYSGKEKNPYMITHLIKEDGRAQSIGAVEHLFESQWMLNHTVKSIKDQLDLASKLIFQTSDGNFVGQNALSAIESGDILVHALNQPLTKINNDATDITSLQNFGSQWQVLAKEITSTPDSIAGNTMPSGTAWRQVEALRQESHSLFELMTENKGLDAERMLREIVIPFLKKKMDEIDELALTLDSQGITQFDSIFVPRKAIKIRNRAIIDAALKGERAPTLDLKQIESQVQEQFNQQGNTRYIKPSDISQKKWSDVLKDLEWEVEVEVTNEPTDKDAVLTTLTTVLQSIGSNPMILQDPNMKMLFNKILSETGAISALELSQVPASQPQLAQQPPVGGSNVAGQLGQMGQIGGNNQGLPA